MAGRIEIEAGGRRHDERLGAAPETSELHGGLGDAPGIGTTLAYVIATQGVAGIAFGVLWARTRSFMLVVALHGLFDAFSNTAPFIDTWRL